MNVTTTVPWTDHANADPVADLNAVFDSGSRIEMSFWVWQELTQCKSVRDKFNMDYNLVLITSDVESLLRKDCKIVINSNLGTSVNSTKKLEVY